MASLGKRGRAEEPGDESSHPTPREPDPLEELRAQLTAHVDSAIGSAISDFSKRTLESTIEFHTKQEAKFEKRFSYIERDLADARSSQDKLSKSHEDSWKAISDLQRALAVAESAIPIRENLDLTDFNRPIDATILRINVPEIVSRNELRSAIRSWLVDADCPTDDRAELLGPESGQRFTVHFKGMAGLATNRLRKARSLLREPGGTWRSFPQLATAARGVVDKFYIDIDKNPCQLKRERDGKRLIKSMQELYPDANFRFNRTDGLISTGALPLALLEPGNDSDPSKVKWHLPAVAQGDFDREKILANFCARAQSSFSAATVQWSG